MTTGLGVALMLVAAVLVPRSATADVTARRADPVPVWSGQDAGSAKPSPPSLPMSTQSPANVSKPRPRTQAGQRARSRSFRDCAELTRVYASGVGRPEAIDRTHGRPVTGFGRSSALYRANRALDLDHDGISCERH